MQLCPLSCTRPKACHNPSSQSARASMPLQLLLRLLSTIRDACALQPVTVIGSRLHPKHFPTADFGRRATGWSCGWPTW